MKVINRVKKSQDFANIVRKGETIKNNSFVIHFTKNDLNFIRVGISVSRKIGHAVIRNRIRRQIRAICGKSINFNAKGLDVIIIARNYFVTNSFQNNLDLLQKEFKKIGINK